MFVFRFRPLFTCFLLLLSVLSEPLTASRMHVLLVGNTATHPNDVGPSCRVDISRMRKELRRAAAYSDQELKLTVIRGRRFDSDLVADWIEGLEVDEDDTVVFYFTGHGYRTARAKSHKWPLLDFDGDSPDLDVWDVTLGVAAKHPRLSIILADCCNNDISSWQVDPVRKPTWDQSKEVQEAEGYKTLFNDFEGVIVASGSIPGDYSYYDRQGGNYTEQFVKSLRMELLSDDPDWDRLFRRVWARLVPDQVPQHEFYEIVAEEAPTS